MDPRIKCDESAYFSARDLEWASILFRFYILAVLFSFLVIIFTYYLIIINNKRKKYSLFFYYFFFLYLLKNGNIITFLMYICIFR